MIQDIGETAGRLWHILNSNDTMSLAQLKKRIGGSSDLVNQAIGWLAREDKVKIEKKGNSIRISLK